MSKRIPPKSIKLGRQFLAARIDRTAVDAEKRTVELAFSSETPVARWWGIEILGHEQGEMNLDWLSSGRAPYLVDHDTGQQIGVIERAWLGNDGKGRALARFGTTPRADQELAECAAGIRVNVSVGYQIDELTLVEVEGDPSDDDVEPTYRAKWTPLEISNVAIPADMSVGIGRAAAGDDGREVRVIAKRQQEKQTMETEQEKAARIEREQREQREREAADTARIEAARTEAGKAERQRVADLLALGERHNQGPLAKEHIEKGTSLAEFRGIMLNTIAPGTALEKPATDLGLSDKEARSF